MCCFSPMPFEALPEQGELAKGLVGFLMKRFVGFDSNPIVSAQPCVPRLQTNTYPK